jgi:hypothetical protein
LILKGDPLLAIFKLLAEKIYVKLAVDLVEKSKDEIKNFTFDIKEKP